MVLNTILHLMTTLIILTSVPGSRACRVCGNFSLTSDIKDPAYENVLKTLEFSKETIKKIQSIEGVIIIIARDENHFYGVETQNHRCSSIWHDHEFQPGEDFFMDLCDDRVIEAVAHVDDKKRENRWQMKLATFEGSVIAIVTDEGLNIKYFAKTASAEQKYKRVKTIPNKDSSSGGKQNGTSVDQNVKKGRQKSRS